MLDLAADIVELAPWAPPADAAPLREIGFRANAWLPEEQDRLRELFAADLTVEDIALQLGRGRGGVQDQLYKLGLRRRNFSPWTELEDAEVVRRYGAETAARITQDLGRSPSAVYVRAAFLGVTETAAPPYDEWEDAQLRAGYAAGVPVAQIAALLGRPLAGVSTRAGALGLRHPAHPEDWSIAEANRALELAETGMLYRDIRAQLESEGFPSRSKASFNAKIRALGYGRGWGRPWTPEENDLLRKAYADGASLTPLRSRLGRSRTSIAHQAKVLKLQGTHAIKAGWRTEPAWTDEELDRLRAEYRKTPTLELAASMGRTKAALTTKAHLLGLTTTSRDFTAEEDAAIRAAVRDGVHVKDLAEALGRWQPTVRRRAKRLGLEFPNRKGQGGRRRKPQPVKPLAIPAVTLGPLLSSMSDASAAAMLGRSAAWVGLARRQLALEKAA